MEAEKRICKRCKHYEYNRGDLQCGKTKKTHTQWSTGEQITTYDFCDQVNHDGNCEMYECQPTVWDEIRPWFADYNWIAWLILSTIALALLCLHFKIGVISQ